MLAVEAPPLGWTPWKSNNLLPAYGPDLTFTTPPTSKPAPEPAPGPGVPIVSAPSLPAIVLPPSPAPLPQ